MLTLNGVCKTFNAGTINEKRGMSWAYFIHIRGPAMSGS